MKSWNKQHEKIPGTFNVWTGPRGRKPNPRESSQKGKLLLQSPPSPFTRPELNP